MGSVNLSDIQTGMTLAEDLCGANGRFLLPAGTVLDDKHLRVMKIWGVTAAEVEGVDQAAASAAALEELDPKLVDKARAVSRRLLACAGQSEGPMAELGRLSVARLARTLSQRPADLRPLFAALEAAEAQDMNQLKAELEKEVPTAAELVQGEVQLISLPDIYQRIIEVINNPRSSSTHIAEVVEKDAGLAAKLLRMVNSPFYGFPSKVDSVQRAVTILGTNELATLALGVTVVEHFKSVPVELLDMRAFWEHSITVGLYSRGLAGFGRQGGAGSGGGSGGGAEQGAEKYFVAGLLHDLGRLILIKSLPRHMALILVASLKFRGPAWQVEKKVLGYDHARVGGLLAKEWKFPPALERLIRYHHNPLACAKAAEPAHVHMADIMAQAMAQGSSGSRLAPPLDAAAWAETRLPDSVLSATVTQADRQYTDIVQSFLDD